MRGEVRWSHVTAQSLGGENIVLARGFLCSKLFCDEEMSGVVCTSMIGRYSKVRRCVTQGSVPRSEDVVGVHQVLDSKMF